MFLLFTAVLCLSTVWGFPVNDEDIALQKIRVEDEARLPTADDLKQFKTAEWANALEIAADVGFVDHQKNPYPAYGHNVEIDMEGKCYLSFNNAEKTSYNLTTARTLPSPNHYWTHDKPCGVCSSLQDLSVYLEKRDLKTPVRNCAVIPFSKKKLKCLKDIGFSERCVWIWYWNTVNTGLSMRNGGCRRICFWHIRTPNIQPYGTHNPCRPMDEHTKAIAEDDPSVPPSGVLQPYYSESSEGLDPATKESLVLSQRTKGSVDPTASKKQTGFCKNTINKGPACEPHQYENGPVRLNPCIQCDECRSGPIFKKISGRVRRNSGIRSAIERPDLPLITHRYFTQNPNIKKEL